MASDLVPEPKYLSGRFDWAAPGDQQEDAWLLRFCDNDLRDMIWTGDDAEAEAWKAWNSHAPGYNCYLFRLAALTPASAPVVDEAVRNPRFKSLRRLIEADMARNGGDSSTMLRAGLILELLDAYDASLPSGGAVAEREAVVAWLRADADLTEQEARRIVANTTGDPRKNAAEWATLVSLKRGLADAIERGQHLRQLDTATILKDRTDD